MNVPSSWNRMLWREKAAYLCSSRQARDFSAACAMLAKRRRIKVNVVPADERKIRYPYAND